MGYLERMNLELKKAFKFLSKISKLLVLLSRVICGQHTMAPAYLNGTVNHTLNFVDPQIGVTTNHVIEKVSKRQKDIISFLVQKKNNITKKILKDLKNACNKEKDKTMYFI